MFTQEITPETPLVQMTAGQLADYLDTRAAAAAQAAQAAPAAAGSAATPGQRPAALCTESKVLCSYSAFPMLPPSATSGA